VFEPFFATAHEIYAEIGAEILHYPVRILAEVIQFLILVGLIWVVAIGFGKRRGFVANMLSERHEYTRARVEEASHAEGALEAAKHEAAAIARAARSEARTLVAQAKHDADEIEATARAETETEVARIAERSEAALTTEREEMLLELRDQLVELVSSATRAIMNEKLTVAEQRKLIEEGIVDSVSASEGKPRRTPAVASAAAKGA
jgi:F0F1-type ATP synthase membrane subunit b/b'